MEFVPRWQRFHLKIFLVRGFQFLGGVCVRVISDNTRVLVILGAGKNGTVAREMEMFAQDFGFRWHLIEAGHKDRNGKVEKAHQYVQTNFLPNRTFHNLEDLNQKLIEWQVKIFHRKVGKLGFTPADRWPEERAHLGPLPLYIPEYSRTQSLKVDEYGWIWLSSSKYSAPDR